MAGASRLPGAEFWSNWEDIDLNLQFVFNWKITSEAAIHHPAP